MTMEPFQAIPGRDVRVPIYFEPYARDIGERVITAQLDIPRMPAELAASWRHVACLDHLSRPGEVAALRSAELAQWAQAQQACEQVRAFAASTGFAQPLADSKESLLVCFGAVFHDDSHGFSEHAFCVLWLSEDEQLDLYFPHAGQRVPLRYGTVVLFDSCNPHGVLRRGATCFDEAEYVQPPLAVQLFLSWDMSLKDGKLREILGVRLCNDVVEFKYMTAPCVNGTPRQVDAHSGAWVE